MKLVITAPGGKMGKLVVQEALKRPEEFTIAGGIGPAGREYIGRDICAAAGMAGSAGALTYASAEEIIPQCDGVIDFSTTEGAMAALRCCVQHKKPMLIGTTGFSPEQEAEIREAAKVIPILEAHNTSRAVNLIYGLARIMTRVLGPESDIEIIEMHDNKKLDAPSGTSKELGAAIAEELGKNLSDIAEFGRHGRGVRTPGNIGYHSLRIGSESSTHTLVFGMDGERIELTHRSYNFSTFAKGSLDGILYLMDKPAGMYEYRQVLGL